MEKFSFGPPGHEFRKKVQENEYSSEKAQEYLDRIEKTRRAYLNGEYMTGYSTLDNTASIQSGASYSIDDRALNNVYSEMKNLTQEIGDKNNLAVDEKFRADSLKRLGEIEDELFDDLLPPDRHASFSEEKRIEAEQKIRNFLQSCYFDQSRQFDDDFEMYKKKYKRQFRTLLERLSFPILRQDEKLKKSSEAWADGLDVKNIIDTNLNFIDKEELDFINPLALKIICEQDKEFSVQRITESIKSFNPTNRKTGFLMILLTDIIGAEEARKLLNDLIISEREEAILNNLKYARSFITPNHDKVAIENLQKFYQENIKFEEYKVNERMNEREMKLLESLIKKDQKVLEMGCGAGRLITELVRGGYDVAGYDFTERHVRITKEEIEKSGHEAKVFQGDWHNNALADESLDAIYSLGRNILHDYSIADQAQLFREANRILKKGGRFIFDIPNRDTGGYAKMVKEYEEEMKKRGIRNFRYGTIYDSPDGKNFATRYAYSHEDIEELAKLTGFKILKVEKRKLETGQDDENCYYVLEKISQ